MNWGILTFVIVAGVILLVFVVIKDMQDKRKLEEKIKQDYPKAKNEEGDIETEEPMK